MGYLPPSVYLDAYSKIRAYDNTRNLAATVEVHRYRNNSMDGDPDATCVEARKEGVRIIKAVKKLYASVMDVKYDSIASDAVLMVPNEKKAQWLPVFRDIPLDLGAISRSVRGKGSIRDIETTIAAAIGVDRLKPSYTEIQAFCDDYVGLDCNGFVGNWIDHMGFKVSATMYGPNTHPNDYARRGIHRQSVHEIRFGDVLLWSDHVHIAAVDQVLGYWGDELYVSVCESSNRFGGLHQDVYIFTGKTKKEDLGAIKGSSKQTLLTAKRPKKSGGFSYTNLLVCQVA